MSLFTSISTTTPISDITIEDSTVMGSVASPISYVTTSTVTETYPTQITQTYPTQITETTTYAAQEQEATAKQGMGLLEIAIIGGAILGGAYLMRGR